jgi:hypothetical protein
MYSSSRFGVVVLLLVATVLWAGCDSGGTAGLESGVPSVQFAASGAGAVPTDTTVSIGVTLSDSVGASVSVEVLYANAASSTFYGDVGGFDSLETTAKTVSFPADAGAGAMQTIEVGVANADLSKGSKEAFFALQGLESEGNVEIGDPREFSLSIGAKPIAEARSEGRQAILNGDQVTVTIRGTVSRAFGGYARFQDDSGPTGASGMVIRQVGGGLTEQFQQDISDGVIQPGTELLVTGTLSQFSGLLQINGDDLSSYSVVSQGNPPEPQTVTLSDISAPDGEDYMSELIRVEGLSFPDSDTSDAFQGGTTYTVLNSEGTEFMFRVQGSDETNIAGTPIPNGTFTYEGILGQFNVFSGVDADEGYQLLPMQASDIKPQ